MATVRKAILVAFIWLTAVAVCVAGLPRYLCRCGQGSDRPVALVPSPAPACCCCGGECCAHAEEGAACCQAHSSSLDEPGGKQLDGIHVQGPPTRCTGTLTQADTLAPSPVRTIVEAGAVPAFGLPTPGPAAFTLPPAPSGQPFWEIDLLPPPTDRVIAFQHFLI